MIIVKPQAGCCVSVCGPSYPPSSIRKKQDILCRTCAPFMVGYLPLRCQTVAPPHIFHTPCHYGIFFLAKSLCGLEMCFLGCQHATCNLEKKILIKHTRGRRCQVVP